MPLKTIKLGKKDDIADVIKRIRNIREREILFELESGSLLLSSSDNLKLMKRTGEVLGKKVLITTSDEVGQILGRKAGILLDNEPPSKSVIKVARSDIKPRFADIRRSKKTVTADVPKIEETAEEFITPVLTKFKPKKYYGNLSKIFILVVVVLVVLVFALAVLLPSATITVFARSEPVNRDFEITVDKYFTTVNLSKIQIPAMSFSKDISQTDTFKATGTKLTGTKATGFVVITNLTKNILTLKAKTTTLVASGNRYLFTKDVSGILPNGVTNSQVAVVAEQAGKNYNLASGTKLQIVNAALGSTNQVYATVAQTIAGGDAISSTILSQEDEDRVVSELLKQGLASVESDLSDQNSEPVLIIDNGINKEILAHTADKEVGSATDSFHETLIAKVSGIAVKKNDVLSIIVPKIEQVLSSDKYLLDNAKQDLIMKFKTVDIPNVHGVLAVHFETLAAYRVDSSNLGKILAGKNEMDIKEILLSKPEIDDVKVEFSPNWLVHKAPRLNGKIYIKTILNSVQ